MNLNIGTTPEGKPFTLPADLGDKKIAMLAQSKKGKTYGLGVILEELHDASRPWIATDPANQLWGLRCTPAGTPSAYDVVVFGGDHADIPFDEKAGDRMAEALLAEPLCAVIDLSMESMGATRRFMTDFAGRLMRTRTEIPRVIVLEEAPVLIPQNTFGVQAQVCKTAVAKLATVGGNFGYGVIPASQRPATMDKNVLSQCEGLIVMGITHRKDRDTVREWMEAKDIGDQARGAFEELGSLKPGEAWYWNPADDVFQRFTFRKRHTLHPREMQKLGLKPSAVQLGDARRFVEKVKNELARQQVTVCDVPKDPKMRKALAAAAQAAGSDLSTKSGKVNQAVREINAGAIIDMHPQIVALRQHIADLEAALEKQRTDLRAEQAKVADMALRLHAVREQMRPQFEALQKLFGQIGEAPGSAAIDESKWGQWLEKAAKIGARKGLEILLQRRRLTQQQLATLSGLSIRGGHWRKCRAFYTKNNLARIDGEEIEVVSL